MSATYISIPTADLIAVLVNAGFTEVDLPGVHERTFERAHTSYPNVSVRVYTSITKGAEGARGYAQDRIMVCAFYGANDAKGSDQSRKSRGSFLFAAQGVNRSSAETNQAVAVAAILDRMLSRMRSTWKRIGKVASCPTCKEPVRFARVKTHSSPNFKRHYVACMSSACKYFRWDVERKAVA